MLLSFIESDAPGEKDYEEIETDESIGSKNDLHNEDHAVDISYQSIRNVFNTVESTSNDEKKRLIQEIRTKPFEELISLANEKQKQADQRIEQLLTVHYLPQDKFPIIISNEQSKLHMNNMNYPELFTY